jgi:alanyl-tRNA synthetase
MESGRLRVGDTVDAQVDQIRRQDIRRNHTATHLLHAWLHKVLGGHAVQAGSLVAPDKLRFDFNHPDAVTTAQLEEIESGVNLDVLHNYPLTIRVKSLQDALKDGATALFGEKYGQDVRTISIGDEERISYELCGGTHVDETGDIGLFLITSEGSAAAGVRRIEAVTGRGAYDLVKHRNQLLKKSASELSTSPEELPDRINQLVREQDHLRKQILTLKQKSARQEFEEQISKADHVNSVAVLGFKMDGADADTLRSLTDLFREKHPSSVVLLGSAVDEKPMLICSVSDDLVKKGIHAGELVKLAAQKIGGSGGGRPNLAQAGGKDPSKLDETIWETILVIKSKLAAL